MSSSWPPAPTVEDCDEDELSPVTNQTGNMSNLKAAVTPQQSTYSATSAPAPSGSVLSTPVTTMPGPWSPASVIDDSDSYDMPALEEAQAPQIPTSPFAPSLPGSWPLAPTVEDDDEKSPSAGDYDDMSGLDEGAAPQNPVNSGTSAAASGGPSPSHGHNDTNTQAPPHPLPFPFPFLPGSTVTGAGVYTLPAGQAAHTQSLATMLTQVFGPLIGHSAGTVPSQAAVPSPLASMADLVAALHEQHHTESGDEEDEDEDEDEEEYDGEHDDEESGDDDDDDDMPSLEAVSQSGIPPAAPLSQLPTEDSQDEEEDGEWEDVDDDMPSLEAAPPLVTPAQPAPNPGLIPVTAMFSSFAQALASAVQNPQTTPFGATTSQSAEPQVTNEAAPNAGLTNGLGNPPTGTQQFPPPWNLPFPDLPPGSMSISVGTLSANGGFTPAPAQMQQSLTDFTAAMDQAMAAMQANGFPFFNTHHPAFAPGPPFNATEFVDSLERVDIANIPEEDMRCPHCWLPFGTTDEDDPEFVFTPDRDETPANAERQVAFHDMPFCTGRPDNDPVRTPCGHIFGRGCLIETLERVNTRCPTCRQEFRSTASSSSGAN